MFLFIIWNTLSIIGGITTLIGLYEIYKKLLGWRKGKKELQRKIILLQTSDHFIAHVIHLGGEFSNMYSLQVYSDEEGGYYFNPPEDFVGVSFNRGGDLTVITPTQLSSEYNFVIDSMASSDRIYTKTLHRDICHLPQCSIKNEHFIRFIKIK